MKDFEEFRKSGQTPPPALSEAIRFRVDSDLNPSIARVFSKIALIHFFTALFTLSVCPQFGFKLFGSDPGLMHYFMALGETGCAIACGSFFVGTSLAVAILILSQDELRHLRRNRFLELGALVLLSMGAFVMRDPSTTLTGFGVAWLFGALMTAGATVEVGWAIRKFAVKTNE
ncbi:MAG: hypothetical protein JNL01_03780 [Bdellovibrionales bacterium]|nr:hypothetical protein [Bdellovibrionales bacterium]